MRQQDDDDAKLSKAVSRAMKAVLASLEQEPGIILIADSVKNETDQSLDEITAWLFRRREDNGHCRN